MKAVIVPTVLIFALMISPGAHATDSLESPSVRVEVGVKSDNPTEIFLLKDSAPGHAGWTPVLDGSGFLHVRTAAGIRVCKPEHTITLPPVLLVTGDCGVGTFEQRISTTAEADVLHVETRLLLNQDAAINSAEDRYAFLPQKHPLTSESQGPLDFVWSQNLKREADDLIPASGFKSPAVMLQQDSTFAAILPVVSDRHVDIRALDLDVTSERRPWIAFGAIPSQPHDHSYFRRDIAVVLPAPGRVVHYEYDLVLSTQPERLGYRRVTRLLWQRMGHPALLASADEQQNPLRPQLASFASWRQDAWHIYADRIYMSFPCGQLTCGTLASNRDPAGDWAKTQPDAWFNAWFQTLRTAYGWYLYGQANHDTVMMSKAESVLNLALAAPQKNGAFSTIYLARDNRWQPGDGWAGYSDSYHAFSMSWTAYWMLRWADDLVPSRKEEILRFVRPYGEFLLRQQQPNGVIPSWYLAASLKPREAMRDFNAETGASALLLVALAHSTHEQRYLDAAEHAMAFVQREVLPRQRWFDFETYLSCARKPFDFFDPWTAQYPQNNLAEIQNVQAMLALYQATHKQSYLDKGTAMLDYLLLTQQVWNNPAFTPRLLGGFTTQNTDAEWSDARQCYAAMLLMDFYQATGNFEYLERAVAAARSTFAVAPWENWAHTGHIDEPGALTGFHWGTGSAMTTIEMLAPALGDVFVDLRTKQSVCLDECTVNTVTVDGSTISLTMTSPDPERTFLLRAAAIDPAQTYSIRWNNEPPRAIKGTVLLGDGLRIGPLTRPSE